MQSEPMPDHLLPTLEAWTDSPGWAAELPLWPELVAWVHANARPAPVLYRGVYFGDRAYAEMDLEHYRQGAWEILPGHADVVAFTTDESRAEGYAMEGYVLTLEGASGVRVDDYLSAGATAWQTDEQEWLIPGPATFTVTKLDETATPMRVWLRAENV